MINVEALSAEWQRIDLLGRCLISERKGQVISQNIKQRLRSLQEVIQSIRRIDPWKDLISSKKLLTMDQDILACVVAPEAEPRLGWLYQELQPGITTNYPTPALIRELLFISGDETDNFNQRISTNSPLIRSGLLKEAYKGCFVPIKPGVKAEELLLGLSHDIASAPPGTVEMQADADWHDLVLPGYCINALHEFLYWMQYRDQVINDWGGKACGGPVALFAGPSGTGKTFSAQVLANALGWPLYRVDLGMLVSKYIGETEKNLNALFDAANNKEMVLLFDEAESIFGKRGEIKEARDRYANMEISHLLSRIESHNGPCILTSNLQQQLDPAFARRFQFVIEFPRPNKVARSLLWQKHFPPRAPLSESIDVDLLGETINLTGGQIKNAALQAAFLSAANSSPIDLNSLARAVWMEMGKEGREVMRSNLGILANHLNRESSYA